MPALVRQLTDSAPVIGLVSTIFRGGWLLPQLVSARLMNDKPRKKPYMFVGVGGRAMFWVVAAALWAGLARYPTSMLVLFFASLTVYAVTSGFSSVAWFDIMARAVSLRERGRLMGISQVVSGLMGVAIGALVGVVLGSPAFPFPANYALLFTLAGVAILPSNIAKLLIREPPPDEVKLGSAGPARIRWFQLLVADATFRRVLVCRIMVAMVSLASPFYVVHVSDILGMPQSVIGQFVMAQTLAGVITAAGLGLVVQRYGPQSVIRIGSLIATTGPLFALVVHLAGVGWLTRAYPFVFMALGALNTIWLMGFSNYMMEVAPNRMRPVYIGASNTISGLMMVTPTLGGWLLEATSYPVLFAVTTALMAIGFLVSMTLQPPHEAQSGEARKDTLSP